MGQELTHSVYFKYRNFIGCGINPTSTKAKGLSWGQQSGKVERVSHDPPAS